MSGPILPYDGVCGFCNGVVQFVLKHDRKGVIRFAPLQSGFAHKTLANFPQYGSVDTVVYLQPGEDGGPDRISIRSNAAFQLARYLGGGWKLFLAFRVVPRPIRDFFYDLFARYRYRWFGKYDTCLIPSPEVRSRFLDI